MTAESEQIDNFIMILDNMDTSAKVLGTAGRKTLLKLKIWFKQSDVPDENKMDVAMRLIDLITNYKKHKIADVAQEIEVYDNLNIRITKKLLTEMARAGDIKHSEGLIVKPSKQINVSQRTIPASENSSNREVNIYFFGGTDELADPLAPYVGRAMIGYNDRYVTSIVKETKMKTLLKNAEKLTNEMRVGVVNYQTKSNNGIITDHKKIAFVVPKGDINDLIDRLDKSFREFLNDIRPPAFQVRFVKSKDKLTVVFDIDKFYVPGRYELLAYYHKKYAGISVKNGHAIINIDGTDYPIDETEFGFNKRGNQYDLTHYDFIAKTLIERTRFARELCYQENWKRDYITYTVGQSAISDKRIDEIISNISYEQRNEINKYQRAYRRTLRIIDYKLRKNPTKWAEILQSVGGEKPRPNLSKTPIRRYTLSVLHLTGGL